MGRVWARRNAPEFKRPIIYLRTPKTGSSAIIAGLRNHGVLFDWNADRSKKVVSEDFAGRVVCVGVRTASEFIDKYPVEWADAYKFTVVRNPFLRVLSAWRYLEAVSELNLSQAVDWVADGKCTTSEYYHMLMPYSQMLDEVGGADRILRHEGLKNEWAKFTQSIECQGIVLPRVNTSIGSKCVAVFQKDLVTRLADHFSEDFRRYQYSADPALL